MYRPPRKPAAAVDVLQSALKSFGIAKKVEDYAAFPHWREAVGDEVADVARPVKLIRRKVLVVEVSDSAWAQELSMRKHEFLEQIAALGKGAALEDIRFVTGAPRLR